MFHPQVARLCNGFTQSAQAPLQTEKEGRGGVLLSSLLLAVNLAKEVKWRGSSIVANEKEVPLLLHSCFCLILFLFS